MLSGPLETKKKVQKIIARTKKQSQRDQINLAIENVSLFDFPDVLSEYISANRAAFLVLSLDFNKLTQTPPQIFEMESLRSLTINNNCLKTVDPSLASLKNLEVLSLSHNCLREFNSLEGLKKLTDLNLEWNELPLIPPQSLQTLSSLKRVNFCGNKLTSFPEDLLYLTRLESLNLRDNLIPQLPSQIGCLVNLKNFQLQRNRLSSLPKTLGNLTNLVDISLTGNKLRAPPIESLSLSATSKALLNDNMLTYFLEYDIPEMASNSNYHCWAKLKRLDLDRNQLRTLFVPSTDPSSQDGVKKKLVDSGVVLKKRNQKLDEKEEEEEEESANSKEELRQSPRKDFKKKDRKGKKKGSVIIRKNSKAKTPTLTASLSNPISNQSTESEDPPSCMCCQNFSLGAECEENRRMEKCQSCSQTCCANCLGSPPDSLCHLCTRNSCPAMDVLQSKKPKKSSSTFLSVSMDGRQDQPQSSATLELGQSPSPTKSNLPKGIRPVNSTQQKVPFLKKRPTTPPLQSSEIPKIPLSSTTTPRKFGSSKPQLRGKAMTQVMITPETKLRMSPDFNVHDLREVAHNSIGKFGIPLFLSKADGAKKFVSTENEGHLPSTIPALTMAHGVQSEERFVSGGFRSAVSDCLVPLCGMGEKEMRNGEQEEEVELSGRFWRRLYSLQNLSVVGNLLHTVEEGIAPHLTSLHTLDLSNNRLKSLPKDFASLGRTLCVLDLSRNGLSTTPDVTIAFKGLYQLEDLNLGSNAFETLPPSFSTLTNLYSLNLFNNALSEIPEEIASMWAGFIYGGNRGQKISLKLSYNMFNTFPLAVTKLSKLEELHLSGNFISKLPDELQNLRNLTSLSLGAIKTFNPLRIPVFKTQQLTTLRLRGTNAIFPPKFQSTSQFQEFNISSDPAGPPPGSNPSVNESVSPKLKMTSRLKSDLHDQVIADKLALYSPFPFGVAKLAGRKNEDAFTIKAALCQNPNWYLFAIFDGHGGYDVALYLARHFPTYLENELSLIKDRLTEADQEMRDSEVKNITTSIFETSFLEFNAKLFHEKGINHYTCGSTALLLLKLENYIISGNCGDSRAVLGASGVVTRLSFDHTPQVMSETRRVIRRGGRITMDSVAGRRYRMTTDGTMEIAVTRSFGDGCLVPAMNAMPTVEVVNLNRFLRNLKEPFAGVFVVLGCDGVFDVLSDIEVYQLASLEKNDLCRAAVRICDAAYLNESRDDITVICLRLDLCFRETLLLNPSNSESAMKKEEEEEEKVQRRKSMPSPTGKRVQKPIPTGFKTPRGTEREAQTIRREPEAKKPKPNGKQRGSSSAEEKSFV